MSFLRIIEGMTSASSYPKRRLRWLVLNGILLGASLMQVGCIDLIARAIMDPSGLAADAGSALAENTASSILSTDDVQSLAEVDQSINRLDELIAEGNDSMAGGDLKALREHIASNKDEVTSGRVTEGPDTIGMRSGPFAYSPAMLKPPSRRLGDVHSDPALVSHQPFEQRGDPPFDAVRNNKFKLWREGLPFVGQREHDTIQEDIVWSTSIAPTPTLSYGIDLKTGQLRQGVLSPLQKAQ